MSHNVPVKTTGEKVKANKNIIHRTTSETIRLGKPDLVARIPSNPTTMSINVSQRKKPSSSFQVTGVSLTQKLDIGDDSADDLDESRTDDISRITDNETPSMSEDTCSRDTDDVLQGSTAPIYSSTSTSGLTNVPSEDVSSSISEVKTQSTEDKGEKRIKHKSPHTPITTSTRMLGDRFKVVKVESCVPFYRGRWTCVDYLDHSIHTPKDAYVYCKQQYVKASSLTTYTQAKQCTLTTNTSSTNTSSKVSLPTEKPIPTTSYTCSFTSSRVYPQSELQPATCPPIEQYCYQQQNYSNYNYQQIQYQTSIANMLNTSGYVKPDGMFFVPQSVSVQPNFAPTASNTQPHLSISSLPSSPVTMPQVFTSQVPLQQSVYSTPQNIIYTSQPQNIMRPPVIHSQCSSEPIMSQVQQVISNNLQQINANYMMPLYVSHMNEPNILRSQPLITNHDMSQENALLNNIPNRQETASTNFISSVCPTNIAPEISTISTGDPVILDTPLSTMDNSGAAGTSTVAIDNKIEQAMDLVKSHLMYTVREEVEVLKLRIAELLDRINQLEVENNFLRANASPEVLTALNNAQNQQSECQGNLLAAPETLGVAPN